MVISFVEVDIYYYSICYYAGITQSEVAFLTETNIGRSWNGDICLQVDRRFHVGYKFFSKTEYNSQRTPRFYRYIGYGIGDIKNQG
jgi:hypothetical protein